MNFLVANLISISKNNTIDKIGGKSEVVRAKVSTKTTKSKNKNLVKLFLAKF